MIKRFLFSVLILVLALAPSLADELPIDVVHQLTEAIRKGDKKLIAPFYVVLNGRPASLNWIDSIMASEDNDFISPTWCLDSKTNGQAAVVMVCSLKNARPDFDPAFMIRIENHWRILPEHTDIRVAQGAVSESTMKSLQTLAEWYKSREITLRDEIGKEFEAERKKSTQPNQPEVNDFLIKTFSKRDPKGYPTHRTTPIFTAEQLFGGWRHVNTTHKLVTDIVYKKDGTYTGRLMDNGKLGWSFSGKWKFKDKVLSYEYTASSLASIPVGTKDQDKVIGLTKSQFTIENSSGERETYVRIE